MDRTIVRFPDPALEIVDERFRSLVVEHEVVERLWTGGRWLVSDSADLPPDQWWKP